MFVNLFYAVIYRFFRGLIHFDLLSIYVWIIYKFSVWMPVKEADQRSSAYTLLALSSERFVGDLEVLANDFNIVTIPYYVQTSLLSLFYPSTESVAKSDFFNPAPGTSIDINRKRYQAFLQRLLPLLFTKFKVSAVITSSVWYKADFDIAVVADRLGYPFFALHKENLITSKGHQKVVTDHFKDLGAFSGTLVIVHNQNMKEAFIRSGYCQEHKVKSLGCLRMDSFIHTIEQKQTKPDGDQYDHQRIVFFSFHRATGIWGLSDRFPQDKTQGLGNFFDRVHIAIAAFAQTHEHVQVIIKTKWAGEWVDEIESVLRGAGYDPKAIPNLTLTSTWDAHELIHTSQLIIGYGSTTLLEGAIAAKPVIMPFFGNATKPEYRDYIQFGDEMDLFDIARSEQELTALMEERLRHWEPDPELQQRRFASFERHVSSVHQSARMQYRDVISEWIRKRGSVSI